jgi:hypothetical protein
VTGKFTYFRVCSVPFHIVIAISWWMPDLFGFRSPVKMVTSRKIVIPVGKLDICSFELWFPQITLLWLHLYALQPVRVYMKSQLLCPCHDLGEFSFGAVLLHRHNLIGRGWSCTDHSISSNLVFCNDILWAQKNTQTNCRAYFSPLGMLAGIFRS